MIELPIALIDISGSEYEQIEILIQSGQYTSLEQFVTLAVHNQLRLERSTANHSVQGVKRHAKSDEPSAEAITAFPQAGIEQSRKWEHTEVPADGWKAVTPSHMPLWGQLYRFLPLKLVVRIVVNLLAEGLTSFAEVAGAVGQEGLALGEQLRSTELNLDSDHPSLSVGWPNRARDLRRSLGRFVSQYLGRVTSAGKLDGMSASLGFVGLDSEMQDVKVSSQCIEFSRLPNPILDSLDMPGALSDQEIEYILRHIAACLPGEAGHLRLLRQALGDSGATTADLDLRLRPFYEQVAPDSRWSGNQVALMRSGAIGRMSEMSMVRTKREGRRALYIAQRPDLWTLLGEREDASDDG